jgi:hypothetical protein
MGECGKCAEKARARAAARLAKGGSADGKWSVTFTDPARQGRRYFFENKLAAMAFNAESGGGGTIREVR